MSTLDLGKIKLVWRGPYDNSTAYTPDDVVSSGGASYICIAASTGNAVSNGTYWNLLAQGGTDVGTTLTTQGDILYRDGSGLQKLAAGTSGQVLQTGGSGANPSWVNASGGKTLQVVRQTYTGTANMNNGNLNGTTFADYPTNVEISITPTSPTSIIKVEKMFHYYANNNGGTNWNHLYEKYVYKYSSSSPTSYTNIPSAKGNGSVNTEGLGGYLGTVMASDYSSQSMQYWLHNKPYLVMFHDHDTPSGETLTYKLQVRSAHVGSSMDWKINYDGTNNDDQTTGIIILTELDI
nr:putative carbohydrate binding domain containing protein [uncultured Mediterranean phage uvMED]